MKITYTLLALICFALLSCVKDKPLKESLVDEEGLTKEIRDNIPDSILANLKKAGFPIYGGDNPPDLVNPLIGGRKSSAFSYYDVSPFKLVSSYGIVNEYPIGHRFDDLNLAFYAQNNDSLKIVTDANYGAGNSISSGKNGHIVGNNNNFSIFVFEDFINKTGESGRNVSIYTGSRIPGKRELINFVSAWVMIKHYNNPNNKLIPVGSYRIFEDEDGVSPQTYDATGSWYKSLPDCPCSYNMVKDSSKVTRPEGKWIVSKLPEDYLFHYGATYEARWIPSISGKPGQQCTYDSNGILITGGLAAGSPDKVSPGDATWLERNFPSLIPKVWLAKNTCVTGHCINDVYPWMKDGGMPCWQYLIEWPTNQGNPMNSGQPCASNIVNDIYNRVNNFDYLFDMTQNMTCEEAVFFISNAKISTTIDIDLKRYISGEKISFSSRQVVWNRLNAWKATIPTSNTDLLNIIQKAMNSL